MGTRYRAFAFVLLVSAVDAAPPSCAEGDVSSLLQTRLAAARQSSVGPQPGQMQNVGVAAPLSEQAVRELCAQSDPFQLPAQATTSPKPYEPVVDAKGICTTPQNASAALNNAVAAVLAGLPPWTAQSTPRAQATVRIAYLVQVALEAKLPMVRRVFDRLYSEEDAFLYLSDARILDPSRVEAALGVAGEAARKNVWVRAAPHTGFYTWPRVQVVLDGVEELLLQPWDFLVHLSESDYPLHRADWLRANFARQRDRNFMRVIPRRAAFGEGPGVTWHHWPMWCGHPIVASCGSAFAPSLVEGTRFPMEALERAGMQFGHGPEWVAVTRELAEYALHPGALCLCPRGGGRASDPSVIGRPGLPIAMSLGQRTRALHQPVGRLVACSGDDRWPAGATGQSHGRPGGSRNGAASAAAPFLWPVGILRPHRGGAMKALGVGGQGSRASGETRRKRRTPLSLSLSSTSEP